jgi:hypothetical protein
MSQCTEARRKTFPTVTAMAAHSRVRLDASGYLVLAGASDTDSTRPPPSWSHQLNPIW